MQLTISGYSTALFSTWYFIHEFGLLFDAGDGVVAHLLQKSRKIKHIFISHPDRDHLMGLFQLNQLNARVGGFPKIYYPKHSGSFRAMEEFSKAFDQQVGMSTWIPVEAGDVIELQKNIFVKVIGNRHFPVVDGKVKCFSFHLMEKREKLKPAFQSLPTSELIEIKKNKGEQFITDAVMSTLLSYSADTQVEWDGRWNDSQILIHEATFLEAPDGKIIQERFNKHSVLDHVIKMVAGTKVEHLILGHFSSRYRAQAIDQAIQEAKLKYDLHIPIYRIHPGHYLQNVLVDGKLE